MCRYCFVTRNPSNPESLWRCIGSGNTFPVFVPDRGFSAFSIRHCHRLSGNRVVRLFMPASGARPKETKINPMDCICLCSEVEIIRNRIVNNQRI